MLNLIKFVVNDLWPRWSRDVTPNSNYIYFSKSFPCYHCWLGQPSDGANIAIPKSDFWSSLLVPQFLTQFGYYHIFRTLTPFNIQDLFVAPMVMQRASRRRHISYPKIYHFSRLIDAWPRIAWRLLMAERVTDSTLRKTLRGRWK